MAIKSIYKVYKETIDKEKKVAYILLLYIFDDNKSMKQRVFKAYPLARLRLRPFSKVTTVHLCGHLG